MGGGGSAWRSSPAQGIRAVPVLCCGRKRGREHAQGAAHPLVRSAGLDVQCSGSLTWHGGFARWRHTGVGVLAAGVTYGLRELAQKGEKVLLVLTEGLWWLELRRREVVGEVWRRDVAELAEEGQIGVVPGSWTPWIGVGCSCGGRGRVSVTVA